jgi:hypothetical protein
VRLLSLYAVSSQYRKGGAWIMLQKCPGFAVTSSRILLACDIQRWLSEWFRKRIHLK